MSDFEKEPILKSKLPKEVEKKTREGIPEIFDKVTDSKDKQKKLSIEKMKTITNDEFLNISFNNRIKNVTKPEVDYEELKKGNVPSLTISFDLDGDSEINHNLWAKTTAGQILPDTILSVEVNDITYTRNSLKGEFFNGTKRLIINNGTKLNNILIRDVDYKKSIFDEEVNTFIVNNNLEKENNNYIKEIVRESIYRGIDPKFSILILEDLLKGEKNEKNREKIIEKKLTQVDRILGNYKLQKQNGEKFVDKTALRLFYNLDSKNYEKNSEAYGIEKSKITKKENMSEYLNFTKIDGLDDVADKLGVPKDILYAIFMCESSGRGLGKALPRFESHIYNKYIAQGISKRKAGLLARSYGGMQIMGFNYKKAGYSSVEEFVAAQTGPNAEKEQLKAFANFLNNTPGMITALKNYDYETIATLYNGPNHAVNNYVPKLKKYVHSYS